MRQPLVREIGTYLFKFKIKIVCVKAASFLSWGEYERRETGEI